MATPYIEPDLLKDHSVLKQHIYLPDNPVVDADAANKSYVDGLISGVSAGSGPVAEIITDATHNLTWNSNVITNRATLVTLTLPETADAGTRIIVSGYGAGGWQIAQRAGQQMHFLSTDTTAGVGGYLASATRYDSVELICTVANTEWVVVRSVGNLTVT